MPTSFQNPALPLLLLGLSLLAGGCQLLGIVASKAPARTVPAAYEGLAGKTTAVWIWVDPAVDLDYPRLSLEVATRLQRNLETVRDRGNRRQKRELEGTIFPISPASVVKYQKRDPGLNMTPITQIAPRLEVQRLIYVEIMDFTTQGGAAAGLLRGMATVNISVIEVDPRTKAARPGYEEQGVRLVFPPGSNEEGSSTLTAQAVYQGLVMQLADEASLRFISHPEPDR
jgi:hypothetical protein